MGLDHPTGSCALPQSLICQHTNEPHRPVPSLVALDGPSRWTLLPHIPIIPDLHSQSTPPPHTPLASQDRKKYLTLQTAMEKKLAEAASRAPHCAGGSPQYSHQDGDGECGISHDPFAPINK